MIGHVSQSDLDSLHQQKAPVSAYWQSIMGNRLHGTQECARFYFSTRYIRLGMTNISPKLYCICLVTVLSMLKRLKSAITVFVFEQSDYIFLCVSAIHARRTICKDYVMNCFSILYETFLTKTRPTGALGSTKYVVDCWNSTPPYILIWTRQISTDKSKETRKYSLQKPETH